MDLSFSPEEEAFRSELRDWLNANLEPSWRHRAAGGYRDDDGEDHRRPWQRRLYEGGWLKLGWPAEAGGRPATPSMLAIFQEELARSGAPHLIGHLGVALLAPTLQIHGSDWQRRQYLEQVLSGDLIFCQGFSEPDAGSDLAGLRTKAVRKNGGWVINGQKTWSSCAFMADRSFLLARTDSEVPAHKGIGFFLIDLKQPGVEVRRIQQLTGGGEFCEIFLQDAEVEDCDLVGDPGDGWKIAMTTFLFERGGGLGYAARFRELAESYAELARSTGAGTDSTVRQSVAQAFIDAQVLRLNGLRSLTREQRGLPPGPEAALTKLFWSELDKRVQEGALSLQGPFGALAPGSPHAIDDGWWQYGWMWAQAGTIYAGSSEIQRNIIAERVLGLPRSR